jgi:DNA-binding NtrC family response regulator
MNMHELAAGLSVGRLNRESGHRMKLDSNSSAAGRPSRSEFGALVGESAAMKTVFAAIEGTAMTDAPVLIVGESGTGKELAARTIHRTSSRAAGPFEVVDFSGLSDSLLEAELFGHEGDRGRAFERAERGTLFLDEIGDLPLALQPRLLHALREQEICRRGGTRARRVDVGIIASSTRDLRKDVKMGLFRADLYYRLAVIQIRMPALRERPEDIPPLVRALLPQIARERDLTVQIEPDDQIVASFSKHSWPGNVRELRNCLEQLVILRAIPEIGELDPAINGDASRSDLSRGDPATTPLDGNMDAFEDLHGLPFRIAKAQLVQRFERQYIRRLLRATGGNVAEAARRAGVDRVTLFRAIHRLNHEAPKAFAEGSLSRA